jgi:hypothetical protein
MAECLMCGAMTTVPLPYAWHLRTVACCECGTRMPVDSEVLSKLKKQAAGAVSEIEHLMAAPLMVCLDGRRSPWLRRVRRNRTRGTGLPMRHDAGERHGCAAGGPEQQTPVRARRLQRVLMDNVTDDLDKCQSTADQVIGK